MDSFEFNKIAMAVLGTFFVILGLTFLSEGLYHSEIPETPGYAIAAAEGSESSGGETAAGPAYEPIEPLLASADLTAGEAVFKKCASCHTWEKGGPNKVGPNLWNVVGGPLLSHPDFNYSAGFKEYGADKNWTFEELNGFLFKPKAHIKGTAMGFAGLKDAKDRANIIAWLRTHADSPIALPGS